MANSQLIDFDKQLLLMLNGSDSVFLDALMDTLTTASTWIPFYVALFYMVLKNNENIRQIFLVVGCAVICVVLAGTVDDVLVKPFVARWRPTHDPEIGYLVDVVDGYRGGKYGFFSAHAANTFSIALFFSLVIRHWPFTAMVVLWSLVNCWTRVYLGVHYPGDILAGLLWGTVVALSAFWVYGRIGSTIQSARGNFISSQYTSTGYRLKEVYLVNTVLTLTFVYAIVKACIIA